jgi:hypothetical protein
MHHSRSMRNAMGLWQIGLRWLVVSLSLWRPRFISVSVHVGFVVDEVALGQVFLQVLQFSPVSILPPLLILTRIMWWINYRLTACRSSETFTPLTWTWTYCFLVQSLHSFKKEWNYKHSSSYCLRWIWMTAASRLEMKLVRTHKCSNNWLVKQSP